MVISPFRFSTGPKPQRLVLLAMVSMEMRAKSSPLRITFFIAPTIIGVAKMGWEAEADGPDGPEQAYIISKADTARAIIECLIGEVIISITGI